VHQIEAFAGISEAGARSRNPELFLRGISETAEWVVTKRLAVALAVYVVLAAIAVVTLSDQRIRLVTLAILAMFAVKTWIRRGDVMHPDGERGNDR
jgi:predicted lysophospholipase L1 biosynthesis ABC-type transport system permease subunit